MAEEKVERLTEKLSELKMDYSKTKYNKKTNKYLGILRAKIAQVKRDIVEASKRQKGTGFFVRKEGNATLALIGFPNAGKSSLINLLTNTNSKVAQYAFTTLEVVPGTMLFRDAHIQVLDLPGIIDGAHLGKGGGSTVLSAAKSVDLIIFVLSVEDTEGLRTLIKELRDVGVYINVKRPEIQMKPLVGMQSASTLIEMNKSGIPDDALMVILSGLGIHGVAVNIWDRVGEDELIGILTERIRYIPAIVALNKIDLIDGYKQLADRISREFGIDVVPVSTLTKKNIELFKEILYKRLGIMRVYLKPELRSETASPVTVDEGFTVGDLAKTLHTTLIDDLKCACINGASAKFPNQRVGTSHVLKDGDIVTFIRRGPVPFKSKVKHPGLFKLMEQQRIKGHKPFQQPHLPREQ